MPAAWAWLLPLVLLLALYPWWLWRDAPLFLTPADAFDRLAQHMPLSDAARMLDAGSGSGAALRAWHRAYPTLELQGIESSAMLVFWSRWRCPFARIERGDLWTRDWSDFDIVYLFQRDTDAAGGEPAPPPPDRRGFHHGDKVNFFQYGIQGSRRLNAP